jgi:hypothetical protein
MAGAAARQILGAFFIFLAIFDISASSIADVLLHAPSLTLTYRSQISATTLVSINNQTKEDRGCPFFR